VVGLPSDQTMKRWKRLKYHFLLYIFRYITMVWYCSNCKKNVCSCSNKCPKCGKPRPEEWEMANIGIGIIVKCEKCGKLGDDHEIPTLQFPDGSYKTLCKNCQRTEKWPINGYVPTVVIIIVVAVKGHVMIVVQKDQRDRSGWLGDDKTDTCY